MTNREIALEQALGVVVTVAYQLAVGQSTGNATRVVRH